MLMFLLFGLANFAVANAILSASAEAPGGWGAPVCMSQSCSSGLSTPLGNPISSIVLGSAIASVGAANGGIHMNKSAVVTSDYAPAPASASITDTFDLTSGVSASAPGQFQWI
jgi:hypothetical protein